MAPSRNRERITTFNSEGPSKKTSIDANQARRQKSQHRARKEDGSSPLALPGVQKIKASLRQTRRLLAKDNIAADVRAKTERRLKSLEADLVQAERARKERTIAQRYHAVKFFERQKITRRIQQVRRQLSQSDAHGKGKDVEKLDQRERKRLEKRLEELRVDLNYIIHYPKLKKYISLFPPELRSQPHAHPDPYPHSYASPDATTSQEEKDTDAQREEIRAWVRQQMAAGEMSAEPEVVIRSEAQKTVSAKKNMNADREAEREVATSATSKRDAPVKGGVEGDTFFGDDNEGSGGSRDSDDDASDTDDNEDSMDDDD